MSDIVLDRNDAQVKAGIEKASDLIGTSGDINRSTGLDAKLTTAGITTDDFTTKQVELSQVESSASEIDKVISGITHPSISKFIADLKRDSKHLSILINSDSTGNSPTEWVYLFAQWLVANYPAYTVRYRLWDDTLETYDTAEALNTGTGTNFIDVWNFAISGGRSYNILGETKISKGLFEITNTAIYTDSSDILDMTIINHGHNMTGNGNEWLDSQMHAQFTEQLLQVHPHTSMMYIRQNPYRDNYDNEARINSAIAWARFKNVCIANVWEKFEDRNKDSILYADNIHPSTGLGDTGTQLFLDAVTEEFTKKHELNYKNIESCLNDATYSLNQNSNLNIWTAGDTSAPDGYTLVGCTIERDAVDYYDARKGDSAKITSIGGAGAYIKYRIAGSALDQLKGKSFTLAVRFKTESGNTDTNHGRIGLITNTKVLTNKAQAETNGVWTWRYSSVNVDTTDAYMEARIYINSSSGVSLGEIINIDKIIISEGLTPKGIGL